MCKKFYLLPIGWLEFIDGRSTPTQAGQGQSTDTVIVHRIHVHAVLYQLTDGSNVTLFTSVKKSCFKFRLHSSFMVKISFNVSDWHWSPRECKHTRFNAPTTRCVRWDFSFCFSSWSCHQRRFYPMFYGSSQCWSGEHVSYDVVTGNAKRQDIGSWW